MEMESIYIYKRKRLGFIIMSIVVMTIIVVECARFVFNLYDTSGIGTIDTGLWVDVLSIVVLIDIYLIYLLISNAFYNTDVIILNHVGIVFNIYNMSCVNKLVIKWEHIINIGDEYLAVQNLNIVDETIALDLSNMNANSPNNLLKSIDTKSKSLVSISLKDSQSIRKQLEDPLMKIMLEKYYILYDNIFYFQLENLKIDKADFIQLLEKQKAIAATFKQENEANHILVC